MVCNDGMRALPPRKPNETQPSLRRPDLAGAPDVRSRRGAAAPASGTSVPRHPCSRRSPSLASTGRCRRDELPTPARSTPRTRSPARCVRTQHHRRTAPARGRDLRCSTDFRTRPSRRDRTLATTTAGRSHRTASRTPTPSRAELPAGRGWPAMTTSAFAVEPGDAPRNFRIRTAIVVGFEPTRSATDRPSRREPDTRVRLRSDHGELPHRVR